MAVWGIGAYYKNSTPKNKENDFIQNDCAYVGWDKAEAPAVHKMLDSVKVGDIIYIKSFVPRTKSLKIKAVGIVADNEKQLSTLGTGIKVKWKSKLKPITINLTPEEHKNNVFNNTLYEEFNIRIISALIDELL